MFEKMETDTFVNREHLGEYTEIEFETFVDNKGVEEMEKIKAALHYYKNGEGEPIILLHGIGQSLYTWRNNFEVLMEKHRVYALDLPGHGFSSKPHMAFSVEEFALALESFMDKLEIKQASFVAMGESAGYLLDFAEHNPESVNKLIFISPVLHSLGGGMLKSRVLNSVFGSLATKFSVNFQALKAVLDDCYFDRTLVTKAVVQEYLNFFTDKEQKVIYKLCMANYDDEDVVSAAYTIKKPSLVIFGNDDKITGGKDSDFKRISLENANMLNVRNCGYLVHEEKYDKVNEAILEFLKYKR